VSNDPVDDLVLTIYWNGTRAEELVNGELVDTLTPYSLANS
jgi:hypothetical protein